MNEAARCLRQAANHITNDPEIPYDEKYEAIDAIGDALYALGTDGGEEVSEMLEMLEATQ